MPNYTLKCRCCSEEFTVLTPFSKLKETHCPNCGSRNLERVYAGKTIAVSTNGKGCG